MIFFWTVPCMQSISSRHFIWEYIGDSFLGKLPLCNRFQLGNSFGNAKVFFLESSLYVIVFN